MSTTIKEDALRKAVTEVLLEKSEALIKTAVADYEKQMRDEIGRVVLTLSKHYSVEHFGENLVITLRDARKP
jgi:RNA-binding protein YhbY